MVLPTDGCFSRDADRGLALAALPTPQRAPEIELETNERDPPKVVTISGALSEPDGRCTIDRVLGGGAVRHGRTQYYRHDRAYCGKNEQQQLHGISPPKWENSGCKL
jgi:hypothetical protein